MIEITQEWMDALDKSIEYWKENCQLNPKTYFNSERICALCMLDDIQPTITECFECPVRLYTGKLYCTGMSWSCMLASYKITAIKRVNEDFTDVVQAELDFLVNLKSKCTVKVSLKV